jgi:hypothetical protein
MPPTALRGLLALGLAGVSLACGASSVELYHQGMAAYRKKQNEVAITDLDAFAEKSCGAENADPHCRKAYLTLARAHERRGLPGRAWAAYESALTFPPHTGDQALQASVDRVRQALGENHDQETARAPVIIRYRDEVTDEYNPRSVMISLDLETVLDKDKDASELHGSDFRRVFSGSVAAGEHVVVVEMVHDCKPEGGARCVRSHVRKAWPFDSVARTPATIEIRAYAEPAAGDAPSRPTLELVAR